MASLNMNGPYKLNNQKIDEVVTKTSAGNYALGKDGDNSFTVFYVGRSDSDVNGRLKQWVDKQPNRYVDFKFSYANSPKAAFDKECHNYHDFDESSSLDNEIHPQRPANTNWKCPVCGV